ncbi:MAG: hypothetical protein K5669_11080, partial [Lachnospiraceae bacterium]|nr:hypothetical protein [Lachnospiraceae bacterium]
SYADSCPSNVTPRAWYIYQKMMGELYFDCFNALFPDSKSQIIKYKKDFEKHQNSIEYRRYSSFDEWYKCTLPNQEMFKVIGYRSAREISEIIDTDGKDCGLFGTTPKRIEYWTGRAFFEQERKKRGLSSFNDFLKWFEEERNRQRMQETEYISIDNQYGLIDYVPVVANMADIYLKLNKYT